MRRLFALSKWVHKYVSLLLLLFLAWMSVSGVLMNHPEIISRFSVPAWLIPPQYHPVNWNRNMLTDLVFSHNEPDLAFAGGKPGVWISRDGGRSFTGYNERLPESRYYRKARDLLLLESEERRTLFAAVATSRDEPEPRVTLVRLFFDIHYGKAWGLLGLLMFDFVGLTLLFLCVSAFYTWYFPWQLKRNRRSWLLTHPTTKRLFRTMFRYHLEPGIWFAAFLLLIGGTGLFMRPVRATIRSRCRLPHAVVELSFRDPQRSLLQGLGRRLVSADHPARVAAVHPHHPERRLRLALPAGTAQAVLSPRR